jgi:signal transduction histidine kinase
MIEDPIAPALAAVAGLAAGFVLGNLRIRRKIAGRLTAHPDSEKEKSLTSEEILSARTSLSLAAAPHRHQRPAQISDATSSDAQAASLLDHVPFGLLLIDQAGTVVYRNRGLDALFPLQPAATGISLIETFRDHRFGKVIKRALSENRPTAGDIPLEDTSGNSQLPAPRILRVEASPLPSASPGICWALIRDVTDQVLTEQIRKDFIANASHEIRTPLTLINGYIETLQDGLLQEPETAQRCLDVMARHGERLARLVGDMLAISRLEDAAQALNVETFDFSVCANEVINNLSSLIAEHNAGVEVDTPEGTQSLIIGDRFYWDQILLNLVENALKENPGGGIKIRIGIRPQDGGHRIWVSDSGRGIPRADLPFIFKRFYRGAKHHAQNEIAGTGLGLSIVKRAVEAHGGSITVASTPGQETRFTILLPALNDNDAGKRDP